MEASQWKICVPFTDFSSLSQVSCLSRSFSRPGHPRPPHVLTKVAANQGQFSGSFLQKNLQGYYECSTTLGARGLFFLSPENSRRKPRHQREAPRRKKKNLWSSEPRTSFPCRFRIIYLIKPERNDIWSRVMQRCMTYDLFEGETSKKQNVAVRLSSVLGILLRKNKMHPRSCASNVKERWKNLRHCANAWKTFVRKCSSHCSIRRIYLIVVFQIRKKKMPHKFAQQSDQKKPLRNLLFVLAVGRF